MSEIPVRWSSRAALVAVLAMAVLSVMMLAGCDPFGPAATSPPEDVPSTASPAAPTAAATDALPATPLPPSAITLTMWTTEAFSPTAAITTGQIVAEQAALFEDAQPDVYLDFVLKKPTGKGGVVDYLLTTATVVPGLLPDLAIVDVADLRALVQAGVIQPLEDLLPPDLVADLYPFAVEAGTLDGRLVALQFYADVEHLVYNTGQLTVPPRSWPGVLSNPGTYVFPAGGQGGLVNDAFLSQYLAVRPWPPETAGEGFLEVDSLAAVLQYYQDGITRGVFPADLLEYEDLEDCWLAYADGEAVLSHVSASRYMDRGEQLPAVAPAPIPAINGAGPPISQGWAFVLVTADPARQSVAAEWMVQFMSPDVLAAWNRAAGYLPTRQSVLADAGEADSYARFIHQQLLLARARPQLANYTQVAVSLQRAVEQVVTGTATPEEAAAAAVADQ
ncbi:MAG: extracellular solute-binding protein [Anaerolineae bacterium]